MKAAMKMFSGLAVLCIIAIGVNADDKEKKAKEETVKGSICCAKCELKKSDKCATVVKVTKDGKDTVYYFDDKSAKDHHKDICMTPKKGSVTGTVADKDGKKVITVTKVEYDKDEKKGS